MARSAQVSLTPNSTNTICDMRTTSGGPAVTLRNGHATEPILIYGNENMPVGGATPTLIQGFRLTAGSTLQLQLTGEEIIYGIPGNQTTTMTVDVFRTNWYR